VPHVSLAQSAKLRQAEPREPSLHTPSEPEELRMQMPVVQSRAAEQAAPAAPSLHVPTKEVGGSMQARPSAQSCASLQLAPATPL
jgi:hypothetical protein